MAETTNTIITNPTGKQQLMAHAAKIRDHRSIVSAPGFQDSLNLALLEYTRLLSVGASDANAMAAMGFKLKGAQEFADVFLNLAEAPRRAETPKIVGLDHTA